MRGWRLVPRQITGPEPIVCFAIGPSSMPGLIGRERDVDRDRDVRLVRERARSRARERRLLLDDRHRDEVAGCAARFRDELCRSAAT